MIGAWLIAAKLARGSLLINPASCCQSHVISYPLIDSHHSYRSIHNFTETLEVFNSIRRHAIQISKHALHALAVSDPFLFFHPLFLHPEPFDLTLNLKTRSTSDYQSPFFLSYSYIDPVTTTTQHR